MPVRFLSLAVVGADFPNRRGPTRRFEIMLCTPGEDVELRPEPNNEADEYAVAIYSCRGVQIGYVSAERAPWISRQLADGRFVHAIFQEALPWGAAIRVAFDGARAELPAARASTRDDAFTEGEADPASGFYPDWVPPDE